MPRKPRRVAILVHVPVTAGEPFVCDVSAITEPDERSIDALARVQLHARRLGTSVQVRNACPHLLVVLELFGLSDLLPTTATTTSLEVDRHAEEGKQLGVDEVVDRGDPAV